MPRQESLLTEQLPELPADLARSLRQAGALLASMPEVAVPDPPSIGGAQPLAKNISQYTVTKYYTMSAYPFVVCFPPDFASDVFAAAVAPTQKGETLKSEKFAAIRADAPGVQDFKLTADETGTPFYNPLWCRVYAHYSLTPVKRTTSCIDGLPAEWELEVPGFPSGPLLVRWFGEWADLPAVENLDVITTHLIQHDEKTYCCDGFKPCRGDCIKITLDCDNDIILT